MLAKDIVCKFTISFLDALLDCDVISSLIVGHFRFIHFGSVSEELLGFPSIAAHLVVHDRQGGCLLALTCSSVFYDIN